MSEAKILTLAEMRDIYNKRMPEDFPRSEIKPWFTIEKLYNAGDYFGAGVVSEGKLISYAFIVKRRDVSHVLLDYLAVAEDMRDEGFGTETLRYLKETLDTDGILIETEDADLAVTDEELKKRNRRNSFYACSGAEKTGIKSRVYGVDYDIFNIPVGKSTDADECRKSLETLYRYMIPGIRNILHVKIR